MITRGLQSKIKRSTNSQQLYVTQNFKTFNSCQFDFKRVASANIQFQYQQASNYKSHRSSSSKRKLFKSAKQIETDEKKRSNSFKNISLKTSESMSKRLFLNPRKQLQIPTKKSSGRYNGESRIMNEKKAIVEDIIGRLREKGSMRMQVKRELILKDRKQGQRVDNDIKQENNTESQLNLQEVIQDQIQKNMHYQQIIRMKQAIQQKSLNLTQFESQLGDKINWISGKMEEFQLRENQIKSRQESINKKAELLEMSMLKKIEEQHKTHQMQINNQFYDKIRQINQNNLINSQTIDNQSHKDQSQLSKINYVSQKQTKNKTKTIEQSKTINNNKQQQKTTIEVQSQNSHKSQIVSFDSIQQIQVVERGKPQIIKNASMKLTLKKHQPQRSTINNISSYNNNKSSHKTKQQQAREKRQPQPNAYKQQQNREIKTNVKLKSNDQKQKVTAYLKNINRLTKLLYFIGQITSHFNANMKKIKKYEFKMANLYLLKYIYDRFRHIERTLKILVDKKEIPQDIYQFRVQQNNSIKQSYMKLKAYVNKKLSLPNRQIEGFLQEQSVKLCWQDKRFLNKYLLPQIKRIVEFYHSDTGGKWTQHKVNVCYFRVMIAVFIISEIEYKKIVIDPEGKEHPNYMIDEMDDFNQTQLKQKMTQAYSLFKELLFNEPQ